MISRDKIDRIIERYNEISDKLSNAQGVPISELVELAKEEHERRDVAELAMEYKKNTQALEDINLVIADAKEDEGFLEMALEEKKDLTSKIINIEERLQILLLPKNAEDERGVILEIRAGAGGEEAALFAAKLFRMYSRYAEKRGWRFDILSLSDTGLDGYKEATANIIGQGAFANLKFESGVHRVQRIPETESNGRVHTSTVTVAVLPEAEEIDIHIDDKDLRIDVFRASGAGGQHVNTTDSAVRITHIPSGLVVSQQDEKSQHKNKAKAMKILRARLLNMQKSQQDAEISTLRKEQIGTGDRSERIRTYNYPQSRVTDHRINVTVHSLSNFIDEGELQELIDALIADNRAKKLSS